jgi:hypothetical protein
MEFVDLLSMALVAIMAVVFAAVVFIFLHRWSWFGHGDAWQKEKTVTLPPFWAARPAAWFAFAESKFREKAIISQRRRFDLLLAAMPEKILDQVMDVVDNIPEDIPYDTLKSRLLESHTLSDHEKLEILYKSEPLGGRKPSQMLASMLAYCPAGMEQTIMFQFLFLQRLPVTLRTLLGEQEPGDIRSLAARADRLWATHRPQSHDLVANVDVAEEQPAQIAAVQKKEPLKKKFAGKKFGGRPSAAVGGQAASSSSSGSGSGSGPGGLTHSEQARVGSGLCYFHWTHGVKANKCVAPCSWTGN